MYVCTEQWCSWRERRERRERREGGDVPSNGVVGGRGGGGRGGEGLEARVQEPSHLQYPNSLTEGYELEMGGEGDRDTIS